VWQAWDERLQRQVALKMLRTQPELTDQEREVATKRAMREARITAGLHHPHAVTVYDVVEHEGQPCIVMQLVESTPLSTLLREHGPFTPRETARIGTQVASALAAAHKLRIVHRDVKPGNVLITEDGSALISDFGISHALGDTSITATGMMHGTPAYLAPEVARGEESSFASDVFSLGSTLYTMLEGAPPFGAESNAIALLHKVARGRYPAPTQADGLAPLLEEMLSVAPKRRPDMISVASRLSTMYEGTHIADATTAGEGDDAAELPTVPLGAGAAAAAAAGGGISEPAVETDQLEEPAAETEQLDEPAAETERLDEPAAETERLDEPAAETEQLDEQAPETAMLEEAPADTERHDEPTAPTERVAERAAAPSLSWLVQHHPTGSAPDAGESESAPRHRRRTGALVGILLLLGVVVLAAVIWPALVRPNDGAARDADPTGAGENPATATTPAESPSPEPEPTPTPQTPSPTPTPPAETPAPQPPSPEQRAVDAVIGYYGLMPGDLDTAWNLMTADYQVNHVGGRDAYNAFWGEVSAVEVSGVTAPAPDQAQATLTYYFTDGSVVQEETAYRLVDEGGVLKIAATEVLSSVEL
jgi:hypothetical protein